MFNKKLYKVCSILFIFIMFLGAFSTSMATMMPTAPNSGNAIITPKRVARENIRNGS